MLFAHLRSTPWDPSFVWKDSTSEVAKQINSFHEDYPLRVQATQKCLDNIGITELEVGYLWVANKFLLRTHKRIFREEPLAGKWRNVQVSVGLHRPPPFEDITILMKQMEDSYKISTIMDLLEYYKDFETVHPFQDGNGRVGGVVVAAYSHFLMPGMGYLTVNQ